MFNRNRVVSMAVAGVLASCGLAMADSAGVTAPALSLEPTVVTAQDTSDSSGLIMQGLDKIGAAKPLQNLGINIYGWVEAGYTANLRNNAGSKNNFNTFQLTRPSGFGEEIGNHFELNQLTLRIEKVVDSKKFDVGGMIEASFGTDDDFTRSTGQEFNSLNDLENPSDPSDNFGETPHFAFNQAYVDVNVPVGNGLKIRAGQFYSLLGYESIDPRGNPFYSHSQMFFNIEPLTSTGVLASYRLNDQWAFTGGITRGFNNSFQDNNGAIDGVFQAAFTPNKQLQFILNAEVGPEDSDDTSHYDTMIDPIVVWQATDKLKLAAEGIYEYDGDFNGSAPTDSHAYGDDYGAAVYGSYVINDYLTANARAEWLHTYFFGGINNDPTDGSTVPSLNTYEITLGATVTPFPKDPIGQNLSIRPEIRYDFSEDHVFDVGSGPSAAYRDQWTVGADIIMKF